MFKLKDYHVNCIYMDKFIYKLVVSNSSLDATVVLYCPKTIFYRIVSDLLQSPGRQVYYLYPSVLARAEKNNLGNYRKF